MTITYSTPQPIRCLSCSKEGLVLVLRIYEGSPPTQSFKTVLYPGWTLLPYPMSQYLCSKCSTLPKIREGG